MKSLDKFESSRFSLRAIWIGVILLLALNFFLVYGQEKPKEIKGVYTYYVKIPDTCKVYVGSRGGRYVWLKSKAGNTYKYYLPKVKQ